MPLTKVFETTLDVRDPIGFATDKENHLLAALQAQFAGRCYKGAYLVRVERVLRSSACRIVTSNNSAAGVVDVQFQALVVVFSRWDILVGVRVASQQQVIVGTYEAPGEAPGGAPGGAPGEAEGLERARPRGARAAVAIIPGKGAESLAVGQLVPVRILQAEHAPMQQQASVISTLLTCDQGAPVYRLRAGSVLDLAAQAELAPMLEAVDAELAARGALAAGVLRPGLWFFERLLYAYRGGAALDEGAEVPTGGAAAWAGPAPLRAEEGALRNVVETVRRALGGEAVPVAGHWYRPLSVYRSSPLAACAEAAPAGLSAPLDCQPRVAFAELLKNILDFLVATRQMAELYDTRDLIDSHNNLWAAMRAAQKPL